MAQMWNAHLDALVGRIHGHAGDTLVSIEDRGAGIGCECVPVPSLSSRLDVLLLQKPHVKKQGFSHTFVGLGIGMSVAAVHSQRPWAAVVAYGIEVVNNVGQAPTFWTARDSSFIDVTLTSPSMSQFIGDWKVRCDWTTSDHNSVDITLRVPRGRGGGDTANMRFDIHRADWKRFSESLADLLRSRLEVLGLQSAEDVKEMTDTLTIIL
ncbi:TRAS6 protein [Lasius niger]|uniref:TRAS6 protein n=1 Tax=Lasius niger TaxID=67767 RepID=A0A0J7KRU4_LASNI|nr:TRAS6 protein [Lasius niger]